MKLNPEIMIMELGGDFVAVPTGETSEKLHGIIRLNETAAFIVKCLQEETTPAQIVDALLKEYEVERPEAEKHVTDMLDKLSKIGAIEE